MLRHPISHTKTVESKLAEEYVNFLIDEAIMKAMDIDDVKRETSGDKTMQKAISYVRSGSRYEMKSQC